MEDYLDLLLDSKQVAEAFGVQPNTVSSWVQKQRLRGQPMPRKARRKGRKFKLRDVLLFAQCAEDDGASEEQLRAWWEKQKDTLISAQGGGVSSTDVLRSSA